MIYEYALDLKVARRQSGLSQEDCAHLLGIDQPRLSKMEAGKSMPSIYELSILCLVFNMPPASMHDRILASIAQALEERLASMPACPENWPGRNNRSYTLNALAERLETLSRKSL